MLTETILALLVAERDKLNKAIEALEGPIKRIGRPPKSPVAAAVDYNNSSMPDWVKPKAFRRETPDATIKHKVRTAAQRKAHGLRMKAYWAKRKAESKSTAAPEPTRKKRTFTAAQRKQLGQKMKAYWAKRKAEANSQAKPKAVRAK